VLIQTPLPPQYLNDFTMKDTYITIQNQTIFTRFYKDFDSNLPTIVFLHEALGSVAQWRDFPKLVAENTPFNVFAFDRLGHGLSDPILKKRGAHYLHDEASEMTPSVFAHFGIEKPILFGHSDGGSIALLYASRFPTRAIIAEAAHVFVEPITLHGIEEALIRKAFLIDRLKRYHGNKTEDLFSAWADTWLDKSFENWNIEGFLKDIKCKSLIIQGVNDEYGTVEQVERIVEGIGENVEKFIIPDCGHTPHKDAELIVLDKISKMLIGFE
jgi:pimeloyl-ACP methyl ester carboxylesterase